MKNSFLLFDFLYLMSASLVYVGAGFLSYSVAQFLWGESILSKVCAIFFGYALFLHFFVLLVALLRKIIQPPLREGTFPIGMNRDYVAWGFNSICHGIVIASPFASQIFFVFYLNWLYYRLMGMKLPLNTLIGTNATIRQPELIELGSSSVIGVGCVMIGHYSPNRRDHCHGRVRIGDNTLVGAFTVVSPGVTIGHDTVVGLNCVLSFNSSIGSNVRIGPGCFINAGSKIPDNVKIKSNTVIFANMQLQEGEIWGGNPAVCEIKAK